MHHVRRATRGEKLLFYDIVAGEEEVKSNRGGKASLAYDFKMGSWPIGMRFSNRTGFIFRLYPMKVSFMQLAYSP
jgi:hypothetical protein